MKSLILIITFLLCLLGMATAQTEDELAGAMGINEYSTQPLDEPMLEDETSTTFILDNTKTKVGRDLYEEFYRQWTGIQLDSAAMEQFKASVLVNSELIIDVEEVPSPGISNIVSIKVGDLMVWQQFVQTRSEAMEIQVAGAVQEVLEYFIGYLEIQSQLGTQDQSGTGIY